MNFKNTFKSVFRREYLMFSHVKNVDIFIVQKNMYATNIRLYYKSHTP